MKRVILLFTLLLAFQAFSQDDYYGEEVEPNLEWYTDLEEAKAESIRTNKTILMYFTGSDWCAPCKLLKKDFFSSEKFEEKSENFILVKVDMPRRMDIITPEQKEKNKVLVQKFNKEGSFPNIVALNQNLNILGELSGYTFLRETDRHFAFVDSFISSK